MKPPSASVTCWILEVVEPGCILSSLGIIGNGVTMEAYWESDVFWWVLFKILLQPFKKIIV